MSEKSTEFGNWSLSEIVDGRYFQVPDYQRGYAWTARQLEEFWGDFSAVRKSGERHYVGAITVEALPTSPESSSRKGYEVVDGQQRLTTIAILLATLKLDRNPFVFEESGVARHVFSYGEHNDDLQFLRDVLTCRELRAPENSHQRNLKYALDFFASKVCNLGAAQRLDLCDLVMTRLTFDFRILSPDYNSGVIFETMNNRGKPLTLLEKLKNRLMYLVNTLAADGDEEGAEVFEYDKVRLRENINNAWGSIYRLLASNPNEEPLDEDEFVAAHLSVYRAPKESVYSKAVAESRLFKMFCHDAERHPKSERVDECDANAVARAPKEGKVTLDKIGDYVEDLKSFAEPWAKVHADFDSAMGRCRLLSGTLEVKVFLAAVLMHAETEEMRQSVFERAESILFRNTFQSVMDEVTFATLARRLHGKCLDMLRRGDAEPMTANDSLQKLVDVERDQLDIGKLVDYFAGLMKRQQSPYGFYGWPGLKYFLFKLEGANGLEWNKFSEATLEHIMPQSSSADNDDGWWTRQILDYAVASGFESQDNLSEQEEKALRQCKRNLVNSLGNFVLLTQSENASVSDDPWEGYPANGVHKEVIGKKAFYSDLEHTSSSGARGVAEIEGAWNAFRIRERGRRLLGQLAEMLGITDGFNEESADISLGFDAVRSLSNTEFEPLSDGEVNRLAPRLGTAAGKQLEQQHGDNANEANIAFWNGFGEWCSRNDKDWCRANFANRGMSNFDPEGNNHSLYIFFTIGHRAAHIHGLGPLVTVGIYCKKGEEQRQHVKGYKDDFKKIGEYQDWDYGNGTQGAKRICFIRQANWHQPTEELFSQMAEDYESIRGILVNHNDWQQ